MTEVLYKKAAESAKITGNDVVFDAYSGIMTIGMVTSKYAKRVIAVKLVKEAVADARRNAKENGANNISFYCDYASSFMVSLAKRGEPQITPFGPCEKRRSQKHTGATKYGWEKSDKYGCIGLVNDTY